MTSDATIQRSLRLADEQGADINPYHWARTFGRTKEEIEALLVRDRRERREAA